ncbi:MAG TPA: peptide chain release factor N(5)-glutamine methyltransferase [Xanthobacteraceae bacterium]|jgi:release factor glutamine methyltransferase|nr:peptide chain release factor N(5)-glutamine methyltransferase [Xanthobacteraceae bacterium]
MQADAAVSRTMRHGAKPSARTLDAARRALAEKFAAAGLDSPQLDARILVGHALGLDHAALLAAAERVLSADEDSAIAVLVERRLAHEPVARIVGTKEFWSLDLRIDDATLVPRPETETVVEAALAAIDRRGARARARALRIVDLGTGSGAILLALLSELKNAHGIGSDINPRALAVARDNAVRLGQSNVAFVACDLAAALRGPFDLIVANPPYIASSDIATLAPEVRLFDPRLALDGGADGLNFYRAIAAAAAELLTPDGAVVVEIGAGQAEPVATIFAAAGLVPSPPRPDLHGVPRALIAAKVAAKKGPEFGANL